MNKTRWGLAFGTRIASEFVAYFCIATCMLPSAYADMLQQAYLKASNTSAGDNFGSAVAISGNTLVVGARAAGSDPNDVDSYQSNHSGINNQKDNFGEGSGAVYVFTRSGSNWSQQAILTASNADPGDAFGQSVAISGDTLVVSAEREASSATGVNGDQNDNSVSGSGAVYVFVREGTNWSQQAYIKASNTEEGDRFGGESGSVAISGDTLVVGASSEDSNATGVNGNQNDNSIDHAGAVYVFTRSGTQWSQQAYLKSSNPDVWSAFGTNVAISGDTLVATEPDENSNATGINGDQNNNLAPSAGAVYVFNRIGTTWSRQAYIKASNTNSHDMFGWGNTVSLSGDTLVVGAPLEDSIATGINGDQDDNSASASGAAYVYTRSGSEWSQQAYLKASNTDPDDYFGWSVSLSGDTLVVGANQEDSNATGTNGNQNDNSVSAAGAAYVFTRNGTTWSQQDYLKASNTEADDNFGRAVAISGSTVVVAARLEDSNATGVNGDQSNNSAENSGAAYVFDTAQGFSINAGLNDAWFNAATPGQGFLISVFPDIRQLFLAWFTYDTERPPEDVSAQLGEPGHRWLTAQGPYEGDMANLTIFMTEGGVFDSAQPAASTDPAGDGTMTLEFADCTEGLVNYEITSLGISGVIPIQRITPDNVPLCETL